MPGILAKIIMSQMMRNKNKRPASSLPKDYAAARESLNNLTKVQPCPKSIKKSREVICGVPCFWFRGSESQAGKVVLYIHGGGFNSGSAEFDNPTPIALLRKSTFSVLSVEYRLAPEHPFPAGLHDCAAVYKALLDKGYSGKDIALIGGSAGGNLVFALALYLRDHGIDLPAALCGISPVGTLDDTPPSRIGREHRDCIIGADFTEEMEHTYLDGHSPTEPYLSPIYGDFTGLPPIWICVGTEEVFYDDALMLKAAAEKANVPVKLLIAQGMCHGYPSIPDRSSREAMRSVRNFLCAQFGVEP